nr:MAG TPA: hypothetical protein [Bacteriophage sp.]
MVPTQGLFFYYIIGGMNAIWVYPNASRSIS